MVFLDSFGTGFVDIEFNIIGCRMQLAYKGPASTTLMQAEAYFSNSFYHDGFLRSGKGLWRRKLFDWILNILGNGS